MQARTMVDNDILSDAWTLLSGNLLNSSNKMEYLLDDDMQYLGTSHYYVIDAVYGAAIEAIEIPLLIFAHRETGRHECVRDTSQSSGRIHMFYYGYDRWPKRLRSSLQYELDGDEPEDVDELIDACRALMSSQQEDGLPESVEALDIDVKEMSYF